MTLLLTGATGFVGRHVQTQLDCVPLTSGAGRVDLCDYAAVKAAVAAIRPDRVLHLAGQSFVPASVRDPLGTYQVNFIGTFNLLSALKEAGFRGRLLLAGSGEVYGRVPAERLPIEETHPLRPRNPYAVSKVAAEALCYQWSQSEGFEVLMARAFNHLGAGQNRAFAISDFACQIAEIRLGRRAPLLKVGDVDVTRDYTDVRDVVRAYRLLLERGVNGEAYNVCSGQERTIRSILERLLQLAGVEARIEVENARLRQSEQRRMLGSSRKIFETTGWKPELPFDQTLRDLLSYWEHELDG